MSRKLLFKDEQVIHDSIKAISSIPKVKVEFLLQKVGGPFAGTFRLSGPWGTRHYYIKAVPKLTPTLIDLVIHQINTTPAPKDAKPLLVSHYITPRLAAKLKQQGIEYADCAGNLFLNWMPLYVEIGGQKHPKKPAGADRLFRPAGLKLIYLLLRNHQAVNATYRTLADDCGIALGAIGDLFAELEKRGNLVVDDQGQRKLCAVEELLQRWQLGYLETLRPKQFLQRCKLSPGYTIQQLPELLQQMADGKQILLGGEAGAALLTSGFQPTEAVLYIEPDLQLKAMLQLHLLPDSHGEVTLLQPFGRQCQWNGWQPEGLTLADPLLTFAELAGSQTDQVAIKLYQQFLVSRLEN